MNSLIANYQNDVSRQKSHPGHPSAREAGFFILSYTPDDTLVPPYQSPSGFVQTI